MADRWLWDDVRFFLAVSREGSFSAAARGLGVDHVTVARRITLLEEQLGAKLLSRTPEGFATTQAGQTILSQCETMEAAGQPRAVPNVSLDSETRSRHHLTGLTPRLK